MRTATHPPYGGGGGGGGVGGVRGMVPGVCGLKVTVRGGGMVPGEVWSQGYGLGGMALSPLPWTE